MDKQNYICQCSVLDIHQDRHKNHSSIQTATICAFIVLFSAVFWLFLSPVVDVLTASGSLLGTFFIRDIVVVSGGKLREDTDSQTPTVAAMMFVGVWYWWLTVADFTCWTVRYYPLIFGTWASLLLIGSSLRPKRFSTNIFHMLSLCNVAPCVRIPQKLIHVMSSKQLQSHFFLECLHRFLFLKREIFTRLWLWLPGTRAGSNRNSHMFSLHTSCCFSNIISLSPAATSWFCLVISTSQQNKWWVVMEKHLFIKRTQNLINATNPSLGRHPKQQCSSWSDYQVSATNIQSQFQNYANANYSSGLKKTSQGVV